MNLDSHKLLHHLNRLNDWKHGKRIAPITIDIALTRACNYKCVYCYGKLQENECKPMTWKVIEHFLDDCKSIGVKAVSLVSDGESTCSPHYINAIQYGNAIGLDMALGTNGYLLNDGALEKILPCLTYLRFNISGAYPHSYAKWHGVDGKYLYKVIDNIKTAVRIKENFHLPVTIGLQMVFIPEMVADVIPLSEMGRDLGVDYTVIKHCSDDEDHRLGVNYKDYNKKDVLAALRKAETYADEKYQVLVKWSKVLSGGKRSYSKCHGAKFIPQLSGSGLFAPCGCFFNDKYKKYHIGNIVETRFIDMFHGERYWEVMNELSSGTFDAKTMCGSLCLQHKCNEFLDEISKDIEHKNFV